MTLPNLQSYGWSPGNYIKAYGCLICRLSIYGDISSRHCYECAENLYKRGSLGILIRQRDELHETTNRYLARARKAEYRANKKDIKAFVDDYTFDINGHKPDAYEKALIEDAIHRFLDRPLLE